MTRDDPPRHQLQGFPDSVLHFVRAMEADRRQVAANFGITEIEIRALFRIAESGNVMPKQLAADLSVTTGAITGVADRLVEAGLAHRVAHPDDRRSLFLELTPKGHTAMKKMHADFVSMLMTAAEGVDADELDSVAETLRSLTGRLNARG